MGDFRQLAMAATALLAASTAAAAADAPICPDRPGKGTGTCTVPAGHWQVEAGLVDRAHDSSGGAHSDFTTFGSSLIKYGLSDRADIELGITPLETFRIHGGGTYEKHSSFGDTLVRAKYRLTSDNAPFAVALDPLVKLPTANRQLGNRKIEAGLTVPMSAPLAGPVSLAVTPELDWRSDLDGNGHHAAMSGVVGLGLAASTRLSLSTELWAARDWDPLGTIKQYSADGSIAYLVSDSVEVDGGANFGLNRMTPEVEVYAGVSTRF